VVIAADGKPVAGAEVVLGSRLVGTAGLSGQDVVRATTDANGRFQARLLEGRFYSAWAGWVAGDRTHVTAVAEAVSGGQVVRLEESAVERRATKLALSGLEPFAAHGPLRLQVHALTDNRLLLGLPAPHDGFIELPPLPDRLEIELLGGGGQTLTTGMLDGTSLRLLPPSVRVTASVVDDRGQPVAGASVALHALGAPAATDAKGQAVLFVQDTTAELRVSKPGFGEAVVLVPAAKAAKLVERHLQVTLRPAARAVHRLLGRDGKPLANATVFASWRIQEGEEPGPTTYGLSGPHVAQSDASGNYTVCGPSDPVRMRAPSVTAVLPQDVRASFAVPADFPSPPATVTRQGTLDLDLADYSLLAVEVSTGEGAPVAAARVSTAPLDHGERAPQATNRRGRICLLLPHGAHRLEAWHPEHGLALVAIATAPEDAAPRVERVSLRPLGRFAGRIVSKDGNPIAGADLWLSEPLGSLADLVAWNFGSHVNGALLRGRTDRDGRFDLRFAPMDGFRWQIWVRSGTRRVQYDLPEAGEAAAEIVLR
jgi:hypothetical protein